MEQTVAIIKPDTVRKGGSVIGHIFIMAAAVHGLQPVAMWMGDLPVADWEKFYAEHRGKPFFAELVGFMCSGPSIYIVFEGPDAIAGWRKLMGATDPTKADPASIRGLHGTGGPANAVHGSDSPESVVRERMILFGMED